MEIRRWAVYSLAIDFVLVPLSHGERSLQVYAVSWPIGNDMSDPVEAPLLPEPRNHLTASSRKFLRAMSIAFRGKSHSPGSRSVTAAN
jgi:hypothetical protein